jgi:hypothetical protein
VSLESTVTKVLRDHPAGKINFKIDTIVINRVQMEKVAKAIENGDISVEAKGTGDRLGAAYLSWKSRRFTEGEKKLLGTIAVKNEDVVKDAIGRAAVFHESVHALMDVNGSKITMHDDEVAAYLADALYLKLSGKTQVSGGPKEKAIFNAAFAIVDSKSLIKKAPVTLRWDDCDALRDAIKAHSAYGG